MLSHHWEMLISIRTVQVLGLVKIARTGLRTFSAKEGAGTDLWGYKEVSASEEELVTSVPGKGSVGRAVEAGTMAADAFGEHLVFLHQLLGPVLCSKLWFKQRWDQSCFSLTCRFLQAGRFHQAFQLLVFPRREERGRTSLSCEKWENMHVGLSSRWGSLEN